MSHASGIAMTHVDALRSCGLRRQLTSSLGSHLPSSNHFCHQKMNTIRIKSTLVKSLFVFCITLFATTARAGLVVEAQGKLYEVGTVSGLLSTLRPVIEAQPWYGDSILAGDLANAVADQLGTQQHDQLGPMFGFKIYDGIGADYTTSMVYKMNVSQAQEQNAAAGVWINYATGRYIIASAVPEPSTPLLVITAAALLVVRKMRLYGGRSLPLRAPA